MLRKVGPAALKDHFMLMDTICDATQERQDAVTELVSRQEQVRTTYDPQSAAFEPSEQNHAHWCAVCETIFTGPISPQEDHSEVLSPLIRVPADVAARPSAQTRTMLCRRALHFVHLDACPRPHMPSSDENHLLMTRALGGNAAGHDGGGGRLQQQQHQPPAGDPGEGRRPVPSGSTPPPASTPRCATAGLVRLGRS